MAKPDLEKGSFITESSRLLPTETIKGFGATGEAALSLVSDDKCITDYDPETLTRWGSLLSFKGSIFAQKSMWIISILMMCTAWGVAGVLFFFTSHPENYKTDSLMQVVKYLTVSIAFLLGMFLSACLSRWWDTVKSIESLFGATKKLLMTAINLQLPEDFCVCISRLCVLSMLMVETEMTIRKQPGEEEDNWRARFDELEANGQMTHDERNTLAKVPAMERSFFAWSLVSERLKEIRPLLSQDGVPDTVAYDRLCELVGMGVSSVSSLKTMMTFQIPFIYVHMLGFMVHSVNLMTALGSGISIGLTFATAHKMKQPVDFGTIVNDMLFLMIQASIYQAFLSIGAALSFPVTGDAYRIPLSDMTRTLERQLKLMCKLSSEHDTSSKAGSTSVSRQTTPVPTSAKAKK
jgi:predicted membrane chloride channel (bestrophin family)